MIRKANNKDINAVVNIYDTLHRSEEEGNISIGWKRGIYPTRETAMKAVGRGDLFILEVNGRVLGAAIINNKQLEPYFAAPWEYAAREEEVCVLHTLVIAPDAAGKGYGRQFVRYYEDYAKDHGYHALRLDTNEKNHRARAMYQKLGYKEIAIIPTVFNGIPDVGLVLLEKPV